MPQIPSTSHPVKANEMWSDIMSQYRVSENMVSKISNIWLNLVMENGFPNSIDSLNPLYHALIKKKNQLRKKNKQNQRKKTQKREKEKSEQKRPIILNSIEKLLKQIGF